MKKYLLYFAAVLMLALLGACGGGGSSGTIITPTPGGSVTTTLELAKTSLDPAKAESTTVTATFANNGLPIAGMPVEFSATPGYVTFNPGDGKVYTDVFGKASILMQATSAPPGDVGEVTVSAIINGTSVTKSTPFYVNKTSLRLSTPVLGQSTITAGGSVKVEVPIFDQNGNIYTAQDVDVYFSSVYGNFIADNAVGKVRSNNGKATVTYLAPYSVSTQQRDEITATLGTSVAKTTVTINHRQAENIEYVTSIPAKTELGYKQSVSLNYRVTDSKGTSIPNTPVTFKIEGSASGATLSKSSMTSDAYGYVEVVMTTGTAPTTLWVTASLANGTSAPSAVFSVIPTQALTVTAVSPTSATTVGSNTILPISFKVTDAAGAGVIGQTVALTVIDAIGNSSTAATIQQTSLISDAQGNVSTNLISGTTGTNVWVKATLTSTPTVFTTSGMITIQSSSEGTVSLSLSSLTPKSGEALMATVKFTSLSPPPYPSSSVVIKSDNPALIANTTGTIDSQGNAYIMLTVNPVTSSARVNLWAEIGTSKSPIVLVTVSSSGGGGTGALALSVAPTSAKAGDTVFATVKYTNSEGTISGQKITIISNQPSVIADSSGVTDASGQVVIPLTISSGASNTTVTLYASGASTVSTTTSITVTSSGSGSLTLSVAPTTPKPGDIVTATVQYTNPGASTLAGKVITISSTPSLFTAINTGTTDANGMAIINLQLASTATKDTIISMYATDGSIASASTVVTVDSKSQDAAVLSLSMGATASWSLPNTGIVIQGNKATFVTSQGIPIVGQEITFSIDRVDGWEASGAHVTLNGIAFTESATPTPATTVTMKTDTTGTVLIPTIIEGTTVGNYVIYWRAKATNSGIDYLAFGSTMVTISPTPLTVAGTVAFAATDGVGASSVHPTISGGVAPYSVSSNTTDITASVAGTSVTVTKTIAAKADGTATTAIITVFDSNASSTTFDVSYYK